MISGSATKQLPTGVGRFIRVALNILKYDVISDVPTGRAEISSRPESAAPIALADFWELHLDFVGRTPLGALHQIADGDVGRHRDEPCGCDRSLPMVLWWQRFALRSVPSGAPLLMS